MKIVVTGGAGFIGSHVAEYYVRDNEVIVFDNLSRAALLKRNIKNNNFNWNYLKQFKNVKLVKGDIKNLKEILKATKDADAVVHAAAQTAVTVSIEDPVSDFETNALGTFNVLEACRRNDVKSFIYCSTNKVYGKNVNNVKINEEKSRYSFEKKYQNGIPEDFPIDLCEHTPYGCSKLTGDIYAQDYGKLYGIKTGVFRMSCIYGTRQFGVEDQGWVAWFVIATLLNKPITIYGDGKQVRDVLFVSDVISAFDSFIQKAKSSDIFNLGGGLKFSLSLLELLEMLEKLTGKKSKISYGAWRHSDQKVYISDTSKSEKLLDWKPKISPEEGVKKLVNWVIGNINLF